MTSTTTVFRPGAGHDDGRITVAVAIIVCLSSGPYVAFSRWAARVPLGYDTWPYVYTYWFAGALGVALFAIDIVGPITSRPLRHSQPLLGHIAAPLLLAGWALCSAFWTASPYRTPGQALLMTVVVVTAVWFGFALTFRQQVLSLFIGLHLMTLVSIPLAIGFTSGRFPGDGSWVGMFNNPNSLSPVAGLGVIAAAGLVMLSDDVRLRGIAGLGAAIDLVVVWKASSATGWLALGAASTALGLLVLVRVLYARGVPVARVRGIGAALVAGAAVSLPWLFRLVADVFGKDSTLTGRTVIWDYILDGIGDRWLWGFGFQSFWDDEANRAALGERRAFTTVPDAAHSTFFETLLFLGAIGLLLLAVVVGMSVGRTWREALAGESLTMAWWAAVVTFALFENLTESMIAYHSIFWVLLIAPGFAAVRQSVATESASPPTTSS